MDAYNRLRFAKFLEMPEAENPQTLTLFNGASNESIRRDIRLNTGKAPEFFEIFENYLEFKKITLEQFLDEKIGNDPLNGVQKNKLVERLNLAYQDDPDTTFVIDNASCTYKDLAEAVSGGTPVGLYFAKMQVELWEESRKDTTKYSNYTFTEWAEKNVKAQPALSEKQLTLLGKALWRSYNTLSDKAEINTIQNIGRMIWDNKTGATPAVDKILKLWEGQEPLHILLADQDKAYALTFDANFLKEIINEVENTEQPKKTIEITPQQRLKFANSIRNVKNPDEETVIYGNQSLSANMIADAIEKDTDIGKEHIRMLYNLQVEHYEQDFGHYIDQDLNAETVLPAQREKLADHFNQLAPGDKNPTLLMCEHALSGYEAAIEVRAGSPVGNELVDMVIEDWWSSQDENDSPRTFDEYLDKDIPSGPALESHVELEIEITTVALAEVEPQQQPKPQSNLGCVLATGLTALFVAVTGYFLTSKPISQQEINNALKAQDVSAQQAKPQARTIRMPMEFPAGASKLPNKALTTTELENWIEQVRNARCEEPGFKEMFIGRASSDGSIAFNQALSVRRGESAARIAKENGISRNFGVTGTGETYSNQNNPDPTDRGVDYYCGPDGTESLLPR